MSNAEMLDRLTEVFRTHGYEGASLSLLSEAAGLKRASLYHHFPEGKQGMAAAVLEHVHGRFGRDVLGALAGDADPRARLKALTKALARFYDEGRTGCILGSFSLGSGLASFQGDLAAAFQGWIDATAATLRDAGVPARVARQRAEDAVIRVQGALIVARSLGDTKPFLRTVRSLPDELLRES